MSVADAPRIDPADVPVDRVRTAAGVVELPIVYRRVSAAVALLRADRRAAARLLHPMGLRPVGSPAGGALAGLVLYDYLDTSVGPYGEVGLAVACTPAGAGGGRRRFASVEVLRRADRRRLGFAVLDLPVTTGLALAAGREIWGYPKFVTDLPMTIGPDRVDGEVADPDGGPPICALRAALTGGLRGPMPDLVTYTRHHGVRWRTHVPVEATVELHRDRDARLEVGPSAHPMAVRLRRLGLDGARPLAVAVSHDWEAVLPRGEPG